MTCYIIVFDRRANEPICFGWLSELESHPHDTIFLKKAIPDGIGGSISVDTCMPIWIDPATDNGNCVNVTDVLKSINKTILDWNNDISSRKETEYIEVASCPIVIDVGVCLLEHSEVLAISDEVSLIRQNAYLWGLNINSKHNYPNETIYDIVPRSLNKLVCCKNGLEHSDNRFYSEDYFIYLIWELNTHNIGYKYHWETIIETDNIPGLV